MTPPVSWCRDVSFEAAPSPVRSLRRRSQQLGHPCKKKKDFRPHKPCGHTKAVEGPEGSMSGSTLRLTCAQGCHAAQSVQHHQLQPPQQQEHVTDYAGNALGMCPFQCI